MGLICLTGEIDLSVGSMLALTSGLSVIVFNMTGSILLTLLFALAFGALCGFVNGVLVGGVQMPAFIVTLATMLIYRSFAQYFCHHVDRALIGGGSSVYKMDTAKASYQALFGFGNGKEDLRIHDLRNSDRSWRISLDRHERQRGSGHYRQQL